MKKLSTILPNYFSYVTLVHKHYIPKLKEVIRLHTVQYVNVETKSVFREETVNTEEEALMMSKQYEISAGKLLILFDGKHTAMKAHYFTSTQKGKLHKVYFRISETTFVPTIEK